MELLPYRSLLNYRSSTVCRVEMTTEIDRLVRSTEGRSLINRSVDVEIIFRHHRVSHDMIVIKVVKDDHEQSRLWQSYCRVWLVSVTRMSNRPYQTLITYAWRIYWDMEEWVNDMICRMLLTSHKRGAKYEPATIHLYLNIIGVIWFVASCTYVGTAYPEWRVDYWEFLLIRSSRLIEDAYKSSMM